MQVGVLEDDHADVEIALGLDGPELGEHGLDALEGLGILAFLSPASFLGITRRPAGEDVPADVVQGEAREQGVGHRLTSYVSGTRRGDGTCRWGRSCRTGPDPDRTPGCDGGRLARYWLGS